jgi:hypothetical protein
MCSGRDIISPGKITEHAAGSGSDLKALGDKFSANGFNGI